MSELGPEARSLLDAARREERLRPGQKEAVRAAVVAALAVPAAAAATGGVGAAAKVGLLGSVAGRVVIGVALASSAATATWVVAGRGPPAVERVAPPAASPRLEALPPPAQVELAPEVEVPGSEPAPPEAHPLRPRRVRAPAAKPELSATPAPSPAEDLRPEPSCSLRVEVMLLQKGQLALSAGRPEEALGLFLLHRERCPEGTLHEERDAGRIIALCQLGRSAEAKAEREAFLRSAPRSPHLLRIERACDARAPQ